MPLEKFPGALCDPNGYVRLDTKDENIECSQLRHPKSWVENPRLNVEQPGTSNIPSYVKRKAQR